MKKQRILSLVLVLAMVMSAFTFDITVGAQSTATTVDPKDFSAFEAYGAYVYASQTANAEVQGGLNVLDYDGDGWDSRLYHYLDDKDYIEQQIAAGDTKLSAAYELLKKANATAVTYEYITRTKDGPWTYKSIANKNAFFTIKNFRDDAARSGGMYINITSDVINENVSDVTFIIEYYDNTTSDITVKYCDSEYTEADTDAETDPFVIERNGTDSWQTGVYQVTNAKMDKDWKKTALGNNNSSIKIGSNGDAVYISKILLIPTSVYNNLINPPSTDVEILDEHNDGIDWWTLAKTKGAYISAGDVDSAIGMNVYSANRLYDLNDAADLADFGSKTLGASEKLTAEQIKTYTGIKGHNGFNYAAGSTADSAMKFSRATSSEGIAKDTFFTAKNLREDSNGALQAIPGNLYFGVTSNIITESDDAVYILIEYLDYDPNMSVNTDYNYVNQSTIQPTYACNDANASGLYCKDAPLFRRHNTNVWRTVAIPVTDGNLISTNNAGYKKTGLVDNTYDIKINVNSVDTHISRVGIVKAADVAAKEHIYYAPQAAGDAPTIWLAGDSIVEQLNPVTAYPREGWGMELANYFRQESISSVPPYTNFDENGFRIVKQVNKGVKVINRAKGGKSTRSFLNQIDATAGPTAADTRWSDILNGAKKGDYLFVSFCINDIANRYMVQTNPYLVGDPGDRFSHRANIAEFKAECDKIGVNLVLLTPAAGRGLSTAQDAHIASLHAQGKELGVPVIDVRTYHKALVEALKAANDTSVYPVDKTKLIYNHILDSDINAEYNTSLGLADDTHINQDGAKEICKIIVQEIKRKSASFESLKALEAWINPDADITTMAVPAHQETEIKYEISDVIYLVNGEEKSNYQKGDVAVKLTVTNTGSSANDAVVYVALYDGYGKLVNVVKSEKKDLAAGACAAITTPAIKVPDLDGYKLRKFVWNSRMVPYDTLSSAIVLTADGFNRRASLEWILTRDLGDVTFEIYRDNLHIATTKNGGYIDEGAQRGEHLYQVNAVDSNGNVVGQSAYAAVTVTNLYEVKQDTDVFYTKANINSMGNEYNLNSGICALEGGTVYYAQDAEEGLGLTAADITASYGATSNKFQGAPLVTNGDSHSHKVVRVKDKYGVEKTAWMFSNMYQPSKKSATLGYLTIDELSTSNFTTADTNITVFVELLANRTPPKLAYWSSTTDSAGTTTYGEKSISPTAYTGDTTGEWRLARYDITDAYFCEDTDFSSDAMMRFVSGWGGTPAFISSVVVVKGNAAKAHSVMNKLNNLEFSEANVKDASAKYPDGISADFSSGTPVLNGMDISYSSSANTTADSAGEVTLAADGVGYYGTRQVIHNGALTGTYLYFKLTPEYIYGGSDKLYIDITYKADYDTKLNVNMPSYDKISGNATTGNTSVASVPLVKDLDNNWQQTTFVIDNPGSLRRDNNGSYMRFSVPQSIDDKEKQIRISKIAIRNVDSTPVEVQQSQAEASGHTIHIAADSIAAYYSSETQANPEKLDITGWGMTISDYLTDDITINNKATPGASTVTYANMSSILSSIKQGDYVFISFGHNDQEKNEEWVEIDDYKANLTNWINQIREKQGVPVLITMIPQGKASTGELLENTSFDDRRAAVAEVAKNEDVMLVKLGEAMLDDFNNGKITADQVRDMYCDEGWDNRTHVKGPGAHYISQIIVNSLKQQSPYFAKFVKD